METLQIIKTNAIKAYNAADELGKQLLHNLFGNDIIPQKITDKVKSYEDACYVLGLHPEDISADIKGMDADVKAIKAYTKLIIIARALNEGWKPDWSNSNEYKYYPWFKAASSGRGLSCYDFGYCYSAADVGSRLCYKTSELAEYAGKQFEDIYNDFLNN